MSRGDGLPAGVKKAFSRRGSKLVIVYTCDTVEARTEAVDTFKQGYRGILDWYSVTEHAPRVVVRDGEPRLEHVAEVVVY